METRETYVISVNGRTMDKRLRAYKKIIEGCLIICAGIYELVTGERPPPYRDVLSKS